MAVYDLEEQEQIDALKSWWADNGKLVMLVVILLSSTALGLESINEMFGMMLGYIPTLISAIVVVSLGMIVGEFVRGLILASAGSVEGVPTLAKLAKGAVILIAIFMALQQLGVEVLEQRDRDAGVERQGCY